MSLEPLTSPAASLSLHNLSFTDCRADLVEIAGNLEQRLQHGTGITLLPKTAGVTIEGLRERFPRGNLVVCDFYIKNIERGEEHEWGYRLDGIDNIDHHAPRPIMTRAISSGNQASIYVSANGVVPAEMPVIANHVDCDSVISTGIMRGLIPPHPIFQRAVLRADHTLERDPIGDVLQALEPAQNLDLSLRSLIAVLRDRPLPAEALPFIERSESERRLAVECFRSGSFVRQGDVVLLTSKTAIESSFVVPLFPEAAVVINAYPSKHQSGPLPLWDIKLRLGQSVPPGVTLDTLGVKQFDTQHGGRWNAGSSSRAGGTTKLPQEYLDFISNQMRALA